ncbi:DUF883 family protein [Chitinasiproducens palmae]|uniref:Membrane-anchored ribosome-binding protein, inhibits growth in stationary phase, ElaB/YqjD/DUF883 family n=1 Tax=Chitinasiproducens palmae TaxID=1770053 RepID=A0A1H2PP97_9BURK|nr:DUF883 family protein [Chitinasiproducens palmae]SDV48579.1 Membrane-anchored ribosome-binding protein, inhibits growth in stationary phase, ElaB/YqjD/DUF883 family [Chitinasiproducens palmae]
MGEFKAAGESVDDGIDEAVSGGKKLANKAKRAGKDTANDIKSVLSDIESSLSDSTDLDDLKSRIKGRLDDVKDTFDETQSTVKEKVGAALTTTDGIVRDRPWETVAAAAGIAFLLGVIVGRS